MKLIFKYLKPYTLGIIIGTSIKIAGSLVELALPYILSHIIDDVVPQCRSEDDIYKIINWGGIMMLCSILALVWNIIANRMASRVARDASRGIRHDLFTATMCLSAEATDSFTVPALESRLTSDTYNVHHFLGMIQRLGVRAPILLVGGLVLSFTLDPVLTLIMASVIPFIGITVYIVSKRGVGLYKASQLAGDRMIGIVREDSKGIRVIKALSKKEYEKTRYDMSNTALSQSEKKAQLTMAISSPVINIFLNMGVVLVLFVGALRVNRDLSEAGKIIAFISYFTIISNAMLSITRIFVMYTKGAASAGRISEIIDCANQQKSNPYRQNMSVTEDACKHGDEHICFDNVSFAYDRKNRTLDSISFNLHHGESLGIIGATGSGKSTIIKLLMGMYSTDEGRILIDGRNIKNIREDELHSYFGAAMQNDFLYAGSVEENVKFGRAIDHESVVRAVQIAQAEEFVEKSDGKYDFNLTSKGTNLSGGQKQRLLIARAVAANPDILILDDSSSALDYKTDANLRRAIRDKMRGTTMITVAQRVSSVMSCDKILVIDEGRTVGYGKHDELINNCEIYRQISDSQLGGVLVD